MSQARSTPAITGVRTVGIPVSDQDRAVAFYVETLGFEVRLDRPLGAGSRWIEVAPPGATVSLALEQSRAGRPVGVETGVRLMAADVDATHADLRAKSVDAGDVLRWPGVPPMFAFRDQDGNGLEIVEA
jgi:catechol 2,3-dioxygenase-like lactoylglutathione lyase family enzyme